MAKILYTQAGSDPASIKWPLAGVIQLTFVSGTPITTNDLIAYPSSGAITYPDGRRFPQITPQGSTFTIVK